MDWTGLDWNGMDWTGLDWNGLLQTLFRLICTTDIIILCSQGCTIDSE